MPKYETVIQFPPEYSEATKNETSITTQNNPSLQAKV